MEGIGCFLVLISVLLVAPPTWGSPSLPFRRMERARHLLQRWEQWNGNTPWDKSSSEEIKHGVVGATCAETAMETLRLMYFFRIRASVEIRWSNGAPGSHRFNASNERRFQYAKHVARYLSFYEKKMGASPPLVDPAYLCQSPPSPLSVPSVLRGPFHWPPDPYPLVCEAKKCVTCAHAITSEVKEACNLLNPPEETIESPSPAQVEYERLKSSLQGFPKKQQLLRREVRHEGLPCTATPLQTLAYLTLLREFNFNPSDPSDDDSYNVEWGSVQKIGRNLDYYANMFQDFSLSDMNLKYCKQTEEEESWSSYGTKYDVDPEGALVCAGRTCKACKGYNTEKTPKQWWAYEQGPLHSACALVTSITNYERPLNGPERKCPALTPCGPHGNNNIKWDYVAPCKTKPHRRLPFN